MRRSALPPWVSLPLYLATINLLSNCAIETSNVFIALYAQEKGSSDLQVSFIAAATGIAFLISSLLFGRLSDFHGRVSYIPPGVVPTPPSSLSPLLSHSP